MAFGINNITTVTIDNITSLSNFTEYPEFMINVNNMVWGGIFFFVMLLVLWIILFVAAQNVKNEILHNLMYSGAVVSVLSFFMRAIYVVRNGLVYGMLTDFQMWIFPLVTIVIAAIVWGMKSR